MTKETGNPLYEVKEVAQTSSKDECNKYLSKGWVLISVSSGMEEGYLASRYILGRIKD